MTEAELIIEALDALAGRLWSERGALRAEFRDTAAIEEKLTRIATVKAETIEPAQAGLNQKPDISSAQYSILEGFDPGY